MLMKKHTKHTSLTLPYHGNYGRREWTFIGAPCNVIHEYCDTLIKENPQYKIAFLDAAHQSDDQETFLPLPRFYFYKVCDNTLNQTN